MAQVYPRVANPWMPQGTALQTNSPTPFYAKGEIGCSFNEQNTGNSYLRVQLDSGATSATPIGAVAAGQLAYWKNQSSAIVTNDSRFADVGVSGAINRVAGIFPLAVTAGGGVNGTDGQPLYYVCDLVIQSASFPVQASTALVGATATANTAANTANVVYNTGVTTAPPSQPIGTFLSSTITSGTAPVQVNVGFVQ